MANVAMWQDKQVRAVFEAKAKARLAELQADLQRQEGIIAIDPESGDYFVGETLGKANEAAFAKHPDTWFYFARLDDPQAAIALPSW